MVEVGQKIRLVVPVEGKTTHILTVCVQSKTKTSIVGTIEEGTDLFDKGSSINIPYSYLFSVMNQVVTKTIVVTEINLFSLPKTVDIPYLKNDSQYKQYLQLYGTEFTIEYSDYGDDIVELVNPKNSTMRFIVRVHKDDVKYILNGCNLNQEIRIEKYTP